MMFLFAGHSAGLLNNNHVQLKLPWLLGSQLHGSQRKSYLSAPFFFHLRCEWLVRGRLYMPNLCCESHHRICNFRYGMSASIGFCCSYSGLTDFIDTIPRLLYTKPTSKSQTNNSYDYETFVIVIILTTFLSADPKPDIWLRVWSQNSVPVRQEIPFWWTIQCMKILILIITVSTVAFLWKNLLRALKNTTHSIIIKGEYDWTQTMRKSNGILHLMRHCRSNLEKKQSI